MVTEDQLIVSAGVGVAKPDVPDFRMAENGNGSGECFMIEVLWNDIAGCKMRMEDHLDEPSPVIQFQEV